jgi:DNA polymerase-3 subunit alpha
MRQLMRSLAPTSFDDVAALVALYRPGPMAANMHRDYADRKNGASRSPTCTPTSSPILADTYGPDDLPGVGHAGGPEVRRLRPGRGRQPAQGLRQEDPGPHPGRAREVRRRLHRQGYGEELGTALFDIIEPFADYAFNKSHSYGYGWSPTRRPGSRPTTRSSTWPAC